MHRVTGLLKREASPVWNLWPPPPSTSVPMKQCRKRPTHNMGCFFAPGISSRPPFLNGPTTDEPGGLLQLIRSHRQ